MAPDQTGMLHARLSSSINQEDPMRALTLAAALLLYPAASHAQTAAPAPGSNGGGAVGPSVANLNSPQGATPPGTPNGDTAGDRALRDAAGQNVLGKTETPATAVPGDTKGLDSGVRK